MTEVYEFTNVNALAEDPGKHTSSFLTDTGKKIWIQDKGAGKLDIEFVRAREGRKIFVAYDSASGLCHFATAIDKGYVDSIELNHTPQTGLKVSIIPHPSYYFLPSTHPRFEQLRKILMDNQGKDQLVWVGTFPGADKIIDIRLPAP